METITEMTKLYHSPEWICSDTDFGEPRNLDTLPGVYIIVKQYIDDNLKEIETPVYVGSSSNLKKRLTQHELLKYLTLEYGNDCNLIIFVNYTDHYKEYESFLIKEYQPQFNVSGK